MTAPWTRLRRSELFQPLLATGVGLGIIGLLTVLDPLIPSWPWYVQALALILWGAALMLVILMPCLILLALLLERLLGDKKFKGRTIKAKEKLADSLMSMGTAVQSATLIGLLVFPFTAFIQTVAGGTDPVAALVSWWQRIGGNWMRPTWWSWWHTGMLFILLLMPYAWARSAQRRALDIYDEISPPAPAVAPTAQGTTKQSTIPDPGPPAYVRANEGSRRRRRHRGT
jgi:hypothetical protein